MGRPQAAAASRRFPGDSWRSFGNPARVRHRRRGLPTGMSMERWHRAGDAADVGGDAAEDLRLLRRYEPVLRFTRGELFLPMSVPAYLERCGLWQSAES